MNLLAAGTGTTATEPHGQDEVVGKYCSAQDPRSLDF